MSDDDVFSTKSLEAMRKAAAEATAKGVTLRYEWTEVGWRSEARPDGGVVLRHYVKRPEET